MEEEEGPVETSVLLQDLNPVGTPRKSEGTFDIDMYSARTIQECIHKCSGSEEKLHSRKQP